MRISSFLTAATTLLGLSSASPTSSFSSGHGNGNGNSGSKATAPFYLKINDTQHVIGNAIWNITIGYTYGTKLFYKNKDIVGNAVGHYVSYSTHYPAFISPIGNVRFTTDTFSNK
jgi:hypothetical protein